MLPIHGHFVGKMIRQTKAHSIVLQPAKAAFHRDQPLAATNAVDGFLVTLLQDAALDHGGDLREQVAVGSLGEVAAEPFCRGSSCETRRRPGTILLAVIFTACYE